MRKVMQREEEERAMDTCPRSSGSRRFISRLNNVIAVFVIVAFATALSPRNVSAQCDLVDPGNGNTCMNDITSCELSNGCVSNDVFLAVYNVVGTCASAGVEDGMPCIVNAGAGDPCFDDFGICSSNLIQCTIGSVVTVHLQATMTAQSKDRYDAGLYVALDGGDGLNGDCFTTFLNDTPLEPGSTYPGECQPTCFLTPFDDCLSDADCGGGLDFCDGGYDPVSGGGPFFDAECAEDPNDMCGDLRQDVDTFLTLPPIDIVCQDFDGDGYLDLGTCTSWENSASDGGNKPSCVNQVDTLPQTSAKCKCASLRVGTIIVCKESDCIACEDCGPSGFCEPVVCGDPSDACHTIACVTGQDACVETEIPCDDQDACHTAACDTQTGDCIQTPNDPCVDQDACHTASCDPIDGCIQTPNAPCPAGDACNIGSCDPVLGCILTPIPPCPEGDACETGSCDSVLGCILTPNDPCPEGDACETGSCDSVLGCILTPIPTCPPGDACNIGSCDPVLGCILTPIPTCPQGDACNIGSCDPVLGCILTPIPTCPQGNACETGSCDSELGCILTPNGPCPDDLCNAGSCDPVDGCILTEIPCDPIDACHTAACDLVNGCVQTEIDCPAQDACHIAFCDPVNGCEQIVIVCDPIDACHTSACDTVTGECIQTEIPCDAQDFCHTAACDPVTGSCDQTPIDCSDDGNYCNGEENCNPSIGCVSKGDPCAGSGLKCSESIDACIECASNAQCNDGLTCTLDICSNNTCIHQPQCGACCLDDGGCVDSVNSRECTNDLDGIFHGVGSVCLGDANGDGVDDLCVPAVSTWGMVILLLLLLTGLTLRFDRSRTGVELR